LEENSVKSNKLCNMRRKANALSTKNVWAVGNYYKMNKPQPTLIEHWNGTKWHGMYWLFVGFHDASPMMLYALNVPTADHEYETWFMTKEVNRFLPPD
jgi:hypothetical protein